MARSYSFLDIGPADDGYAALQSAIINAVFAVCINVDSPGGEIAGDEAAFERRRRTRARRARANRYQRSSTWVLPWRRRVAKGGY